MKRTELKETLSLELSIEESNRFRVIFDRAIRRNALCRKAHVIRELLGLADYGLVSETDLAYFRRLNITEAYLDTGLPNSEAPQEGDPDLERDRTIMKSAVAKHSRARRRKSGSAKAS